MKLDTNRIHSNAADNLRVGTDAAAELSNEQLGDLTGGSSSCSGQQYPQVGLGMRKSAGGTISGAIYL